MEIYPEEGTVLQGMEMMCYSSLLNFGHLDHTSGPNCENVLIHGRGKIASDGYPLA